MGDKDDALFKQKVIGIIRRCILPYSPVFLVILGTLGWFFGGMSSTLTANTKTLSRIDTTVSFMNGRVTRLEDNKDER